MSSDIKIASLGRVGDITDAVVIHIRKDNKTTYILSPYDIELMTHVIEVMPTMVSKVLSQSIMCYHTCTIIQFYFIVVERILRENGILYTKSA